MTFTPRKYKIQNIPTLRLGLNDRQDASEIADLEMADCENITVDEGTVMTAPGYIAYGTQVAGKFWGIYQFRKSDGTQRLIRQRGTTLEYDSDGAGTWVGCTMPTAGSPAATVVLTEIQPTFATLNDIVIFSNGTDSVMSSADGITWTLRSTLPKGRIVYNNGLNRIVFARTSAAPSVIWWSDINDPLTVNAASWQYIDPNAGAEIKGAVSTPWGSSLIFKEDRYYDIDDVTSGMVGVTPLGAFKLASHHSIACTEDSVIAAGVDGIYEFSSGTMTKISGKITTGGRNAINLFSTYTAAYIDGKYYLSMPDANVDQNYNSQEYVVHTNLRRGDEEQLYVITRNRRYFGCYGVEYRTVAGSQRVRLYAGDSRPASGSPATTYKVFAYINHTKSTAVTQGLNGEAQSAYFATKFFTNNISYFVKKYKKFFLSYKLDNSVSMTIGYRFLPHGSFTDVSVSQIAESIDFILTDLSEGAFSEGFGFSDTSTGQSFVDLENTERPRGIQFKISFNQVNPITILDMAYRYLTKAKFK